MPLTSGDLKLTDNSWDFRSQTPLVPNHLRDFEWGVTELRWDVSCLFDLVPFLVIADSRRRYLKLAGPKNSGSTLLSSARTATSDPPLHTSRPGGEWQFNPETMDANATYPFRCAASAGRTLSSLGTTSSGGLGAWPTAPQIPSGNYTYVTSPLG